MDIAWDQYKPILRRAYFGQSESCLAIKDSDAANDFWSFFNKYLVVVARKQIRADRNTAIVDDYDIRLNEVGIPLGPFDKSYRSNTKLAIDKTSTYMLREVGLIRLQL
jgi:hypothetical protein